MSKCYFDETITRAEFETIVDIVFGQVKRISHYKIDGGEVVGWVLAQSGISEWQFILDFSDAGHINGSYTVTQENDDSSIPKNVGKRIQERIVNLPHNTDDSFWIEVMKRDGYDFSGKSPYEILQLKRSYLQKRVEISREMESRRQKRQEQEMADIRQRIAAQRAAEAESLRRAAEAEAEQRRVEAEEKKRNDRQAIVAFLLLVAMALVFWGYSAYQEANMPPKIAVSCSSKDFIGMDYKEAQTILKKDGFKNITLIANPDIILGVLAKDGEVEKIVINDKSKFSAGSSFDQDSKVVITYHTKKKQ